MMTSAAACCTCWTIIAIALGLSQNGQGDTYKLGALATTFFFVFFASFGMGVLGVPVSTTDFMSFWTRARQLLCTASTASL